MIPRTTNGGRSECSRDRFNTPLRAERWPVGRHERRPCPVCSRGWTPCAGSLLDCHASCVLTDKGRADLITSYHALGTRSIDVLAVEFGITRGVVLVNLRNAGVHPR